MSDILDLQSSISDSNAKHAILEKHNDFLRKTMGECVDSSDDLQNQVASLKAEVAAQKEGTLRALSTQDRFTRQKMDGLLQVPPSLPPPPPCSSIVTPSFRSSPFLPFPIPKPFLERRRARTIVMIRNEGGGERERERRKACRRDRGRDI
jgi:hypothetical protein